MGRSAGPRPGGLVVPCRKGWTRGPGVLACAPYHRTILLYVLRGACRAAARARVSCGWHRVGGFNTCHVDSDAACHSNCLSCHITRLPAHSILLARQFMSVRTDSLRRLGKDAHCYCEMRGSWGRTVWGNLASKSCAGARAPAESRVAVEPWVWMWMRGGGGDTDRRVARVSRLRVMFDLLPERGRPLRRNDEQCRCARQAVVTGDHLSTYFWVEATTTNVLASVARAR